MQPENTGCMQPGETFSCPWVQPGETFSCPWVQPGDLQLSLGATRRPSVVPGCNQETLGCPWVQPGDPRLSLGATRKPQVHATRRDLRLSLCATSRLSVVPGYNQKTAVYNHWTGLVDWTRGLNWWTDTKNHFLHSLTRLTCLWSCVEPCSLLRSYTVVLEQIIY